MRWNRGISFSLFTQDTAAGRATLLGSTLLAIALLGWWLASSRSYLAAAGLGAIIGGALGNALDRLTHGAVVDYLDLHAFGRHFFVFNLADAAINVGVALLIVDLVFAPREREAGRVRRRKERNAVDDDALAARTFGAGRRHRIAEICVKDAVRRGFSRVAFPRRGS